MLTKQPQMMRKNSFTKQISANNVVGSIELANQQPAATLNQATLINGLTSIRCVIDGPFIQSQKDTIDYSLVARENVTVPEIRSHYPQVVDLNLTNEWQVSPSLC